MIRTYMEDSNKGKQNPGLFSTLSLAHFSLISFLLFFLMKITTSHSADSSYSSPYIPTEDIALSCGSPSTTKFSFHGNLWTSDNASDFGSFPSATTTTITASTQDSSVPRALYKTARLSTSQFNYTFPVSQGMKFVRLHFYPASYISGHDMANSSFSVTANDRFTLIQDFSSYLTAVSLDPSTFIKEFCVNVEGQKLTLSFTPSPLKSGSFAFINGIDVVSMPNTIYIRGLDVDLPIVGFSNTTNINYTTALETLYRLNVGGSAISAGADTGMFLEWLSDDDFVIGYAVTPTFPNTQIRYTNATPAYIAPEDVYRTARTMGNSKRSNLNYNLTWSFNVDSGFNYLVRLHFCEFQPEIQKRGDRVFRIFINNQTVEPFADVIVFSGGNGIPAYRDYFVMNDDQGGSAGNYDLSVALHPNGDSETMYSDAILNGLELFKLIQHGRNLAGSNPEPLPQNLEPTPQSPLAELSKNPRSTNRRPFLFAITGSSVGLVIVFSLVCAFIRWCCRRRRQRSRKVKCFGGGANSKDGEKNSSESSWWDQISASQSHLCRRHLSLAEMRAATDDFDPNLLIGVGGFGHVYKGYVGSELTPVAVKRGKPTSQQGTQEFRNEIEMLSKLRHRNLVSLMGYCHENGEMILVYEYMAHGTLCDHLYKSKSKSNQLPLSWKQRLSVCVGAARGIHYLHSHPIIHRDVKTSNILLDENWTAKVSDFGLSRAGPTSVSKTHVSTDVKGTLGYLDPEYFLRQQLTVQSDVYSFGVVLFEVLCGRPVLDKTLLDSDDVNLAQWA